MKSGFLINWILIVLFLTTPFFVSAAVGDIVIQEVLFNPSDKSDTGLEYIILKNRSSENINLTGWDLYPDGIGYFIFPNFSLISQGEVKIYLNKTGTNDSANLYQGSVSSNMGDSSGSIAIFSGTTHNKDTIQAFVRYQILGKSESKTWESTAVKAGLWQTGDFVNIETLTEGQVIFLSDENNFKSSGGWIVKTPTEEIGGDQSSPPQQPPSQPSGGGSSSDYVPPELLPKIKAYAGEDKTVTVGAATEFRGQAFGLKDEPLDNARYLWTFGDGASKEGKNITHVYQYPGEYIVALNVSSGEYSASDYMLVKAIPNQVFISEIKTGTDSFIELENKSKEEIDISGCQIKYNNPPSGEAGQTFIFPQSTRIRPNAYLVIPSSVSGINLLQGKGIVEFLYSGGFKADSFSYDGFLSESQSFNRANVGSPEGKQVSYGVNLIGPETPGAKNSTKPTPDIGSSNSSIDSNVKKSNTEGSNKTAEESSEKESKNENNTQSANIITVGDSGGAKSNTKIYLFAVLGLVVFAAAAIFFIHRQRGG